MDFSAYLRGLRREPLFRTLDLAVLHTTDSTNSAARRLIDGLADRGLAPRRCLVTAWRQAQGRGRRGRSWTSDPGSGVWASLVWPLEDDAALLTLPLVAAVALSRRLEAIAGTACRVKWPNDLLFDGDKVAGILLEVVRRGERGAAAIVGFGVNWSSPGVPGAAALSEAAQAPPPLAELTGLLASELIDELDCRRAAHEVVAEYAARSAHREGEAIRWKTAEGVAEGVFRGFDGSGLLKVSVGGEERRLAAAELVVE